MAVVPAGPVIGAVLVTLAALVKAPAALGLAAVALLWARTLPGRAPLLRAVLGTGALAGATTVVVTWVSGTGYGWISALTTPISSDNWAPTGVLGRWTADTFAHDDYGADLAIKLWRWAGILAVVVVAGLAWVYREKIGALPGLGAVLLAFAAFGPAFRPWYFLWGLVPLAAALPSVHRHLATVTAVLTPVVLPDGYAADASKVLLAVLGVVMGIAAFVLATTTVPERRVFR